MTPGGPREPSLSIVVPVHDEEEGLEAAVVELLATATAARNEGAVGAVELVVVDDGSDDRSLARARAVARDHSEVLVRAHDRNRGLGAAVRTGIGAAGNDLVLYTDADLPAPPEAVSRAIRLAAGPDATAVSAYRRHRRDDGARRLVYSIAYNGLLRVLFGLRVEDANFALKVAPRDDLQDLGLRSEGSFIDAEILIGLARRGRRIVQFPVDYRPRLTGRSTLSRLSVVWAILGELVAFGRRTGWRRPASPAHEVGDRYTGERVATRAHVRVRLRTCPVDEVVAALPAGGHLLDVGCGHGVMGLAALDAGVVDRVTGVDPDPGKVAVARRAAAAVPGRAEYVEGTLDDLGAEAGYDRALVCDVLYLVPEEAQRDLVRRVARMVGPDGAVVVKEMALTPRWKLAWTRLQERVATGPLGITQGGGSGLTYRAPEVIGSWLEQEGFTVRHRRLDRGRPWPHHVTVAVRGNMAPWP